ncbi:hypothetical protein NDU88_003527 [Pleurodeles waltl]|uniref:Uncharacterized protein n=1 Tax=Pleurodeles waltl TaxID=8319 RepID=A0AAV7M3M6_PLEWA|nr:hypothetical protein NDU88_003527 [Pleurodeles waltl]
MPHLQTSTFVFESIGPLFWHRTTTQSLVVEAYQGLDKYSQLLLQLQIPHTLEILPLTDLSRSSGPSFLLALQNLLAGQMV